MPTRPPSAAAPPAALGPVLLQSRFPARADSEQLKNAPEQKILTWEVVLAPGFRKAGEGLGLDIRHFPRTAGGQSLLVHRVKDGNVQKWNEKHPEEAIKEGDRIIAANDATGDSHKLLETIRASRQELRLTVQRAPGGRKVVVL